MNQISDAQKRAAEQRIDAACAESRSLALDAIFDKALQDALLSYQERLLKRSE